MSRLAMQHNFEPRLYYLNIILSTKDLSLPIKALVDTGCAKSAMSKISFLKLQQSNSNLIIQRSTAKIQTCDGTSHAIMGFINLTIEFPNTNFQLRSQQIMIVEKLSDDFIIGSDILGSQSVSKIKAPLIYFTDGISEFEVKMTVVTYPELHLTSVKKLSIKPNQQFQIITELSGFKPIENPINITTKIPQLKIARIAYEDNQVVTTVRNNKRKIINLPSDVPIIKIQKSLLKHNIPQDEYMDQEEIDKATDLFHEKGFYQPSVTAYIEDRSNITEADKIDIPINVTDNEFIKMFDIDHFHGEHKDYLINILLSTKPAFSMHKYDIGKTHLITMDIELINDNDEKIQKYVPIAMHLTEKANEILEQMEKHDIIRECHAATPYCSNILVIPKKDKNAVRLLFDGRLLNYNTKRMPVAIITKAEILAHLVNKTHLSSLDFADAFFHIPLTERAQNYTAFWTPNHAKKMCFNRAPQGLRNSPMYLKMLLDLIFYDLSENVLFYADDLLIATNGSLKEHLDFVKIVLDKLVHAGLKLRPQKILIARETINFLGMVFYKNTLSIPDLRLKAFQALPIPNTQKRLKSAICMFSYYRHFVPNFSELSRTLTEKANDKTVRKLVLTEEDKQQYNLLIKAICDNAITYYPDKSKPFYIQTDASYYCAGGRLFQKDEHDNELLIAAVSRTFTKTERNYSTYKKEALALLYTLRSMDFFIQGAPKLVLLVDAKAVIYIRLAKEGAPILLRFSLELSKYEADLIHVPGEENVISDILSRHHSDIPAIELDKFDNPKMSEKDTIRIIDALTIPSNFRLTKSELFELLNGPSPPDDTKVTKKAKSKAQPGLKQVKNTPRTLHKRKIKMPRTVRASKEPPNKLVRFQDPLAISAITRAQAKQLNNKPNDINKPDSKRKQNNRRNNKDQPVVITEDEQNNNLTSYTDVQANCTIANGKSITAKQFKDLQMSDPVIAALVDNQTKNVSLHKEVYVKHINNEAKIIIPETLLRTITTLHHYVAPGIHKSQKQIQRDIQSIYYYPQTRLTKIIKEQIGNCHICQLFQEGKQDLKIMQLPRHKAARLSWSIDLITDLPNSVNNYKILLIAVDDFSNYIIAIPIASATSQELIKAIKNHIISPFGIPKFIRSDEQPGIYNSKEFFTFFEGLGIELQATAVASPFSNGRAETTIKIFKHAARKYFHQQNCILNWDEHVPIITTALNSSINSYGFAPEEIMFGHRLENRFALVELPQLNDTNNTNTEQTIDVFLTRVANIRSKYDQLKSSKHQSNATFKNKHAKDKRFEVGDLVLHRQLQVSTGTASKYRPQLTGPYVIQSIEGITAACKHLETNRVIKAHFLNLTPYRYDENSFYPPSQAISTGFGGDNIKI